MSKMLQKDKAGSKPKLKSMAAHTIIPILCIDNTYTFGGAINSLCNLIKFLDRGRFTPVLVTGQPQEFLSEHFDCTWYHYMPRLPWVHNQLYSKIATWPLFRWRFALRLLNIVRFCYWLIFVVVKESLKYYRLGRKHRVALVHLNNIIGSQLSGALAAKLLRVPCIAHMRDFEEVHLITRFYARLVNHFVAVSEAVSENLHRLGVPDERITVVHDALDLSEFQPDKDHHNPFSEFGVTKVQRVFGIFGRVVPWKGIREFILAAKLVTEVMPEARGFVVGGTSDGDENYLKEMKKLASEIGLRDKVFFTGYRHEIPALINRMNVIVHASIRPEPFGMTIIEGMAMEKPVVATRGGGALDIVIDGETGFLVKMGDPEALGQAVVYLLRRPNLEKRMGRKGRLRVEAAFSGERYAHQMEKIFQKFARDPRYCKS